MTFALAYDFRWLLVAPVILWPAALITIGRRVFGDGSRW